MVDLLLDRASCDEAVDGDWLRLTDAPRAFASLRVRARIPIGVENEDAVGSSQVHAETSHSSCEKEQEDARVLTYIR